MPVTFPQFGPFERPLRLHGLSKPSMKPGNKRPLPTPKPRRQSPPAPPAPPLIAMYVSINLHSFWPSSGVPSPAASVALTAAAAAAGCTIALSQEENNGAFNEYGYIAVIAVPAGTPAGDLFTLTTSGTRPVVPGTPPTYFCGTYSNTAEAHFDHTESGPDGFGGTFSYDVWKGTWQQITPDATTNGTLGPAITSVGGANPLALQVINTNTGTNHFLSYHDGGNLVVTGLPCDADPGPVDTVELLPFGIEIQVNAQAGHTVNSVTWPFSTTDAVRMAPYYGNDTAFWYGLNSSESPSATGLTLYDGVTTYNLLNARWSTVTGDFVPLVYVKSSTGGLKRYDDFIRARVLTPLPDGVAPSHFPWDTGTYGTYRMFTGAQPPVVPFDPTTDPP